MTLSRLLHGELLDKKLSANEARSREYCDAEAASSTNAAFCDVTWSICERLLHHTNQSAHIDPELSPCRVGNARIRKEIDPRKIGACLLIWSRRGGEPPKCTAGLPVLELSSLNPEKGHWRWTAMPTSFVSLRVPCVYRLQS